MTVLMHMGEVAGRSFSVAGLFSSIRHTAERITGDQRDPKIVKLLQPGSDLQSSDGALKAACQKD